MKDEVNTKLEIRWNIVKKIKIYMVGEKFCKFCHKEKVSELEFAIE